MVEAKVWLEQKDDQVKELLLEISLNGKWRQLACLFQLALVVQSAPLSLKIAVQTSKEIWFVVKTHLWKNLKRPKDFWQTQVKWMS